MTGVDLKWWMVKMQLRSSLTWKDSSTSCPRQTVREDPGPECSSQKNDAYWCTMSDEACYKVKLVWGKDFFYPDAKSKTTGFLSEECQLVCKLQSSEHASCRYPCFNRGFPFLRLTKRFFFMFFHVPKNMAFLFHSYDNLVLREANRSRQCSRPCHQICSKKISAFTNALIFCLAHWFVKNQGASIKSDSRQMAHLPWYWLVYHGRLNPTPETCTNSGGAVIFCCWDFVY